MTWDRGFRGQNDGHERPWDWRALARRHGVPERDAQALYEQAVSQARAYREPYRHEQAIYLDLLKEARQRAWRPTPGKVTRTMRLQAERMGKKGRGARVSQLGGRPIAPGKRTLTEYLDAPVSRQRSGGEFGEKALLVTKSPEHAWPHASSEEEQDWSVIDQAFSFDSIPYWQDDQGSAEAASDQPVHGPEYEPEHEEAEEEQGDILDEDTEQHLPEAVLSHMEHAFGQHFDDVTIHPDSAEVPAGAQAFTRGHEIHFRPGVYRPGTSRGAWLVAHELGHVVQQTAGRSAPGAQRRALEAEADRAATLAMLGHRVQISLQAPHGMMQAFSDGEEHEDPADLQDTAPSESAGATASPDGTASPATSAAGTEAAAAPDATDDAQHGASPEATTDAEQAVENEAADEDEDDQAPDGDLVAESDAIASEPVEGGDAGTAAGVAPAGGQGGGDAPDAAAEEAPVTPQGPPEQALAQLEGKRPDLLADALASVHGSVSTGVEGARNAQAQDPPTMSSVGQEGAGQPASGTPSEASREGQGHGAAPRAGQGGAMREGQDHSASTREGQDHGAPPRAGQGGAVREGQGTAAQASTPGRGEPAHDAQHGARGDGRGDGQEGSGNAGRVSDARAAGGVAHDRAAPGAQSAATPAAGNQPQQGRGRPPAGPPATVGGLLEEVAASVRSWFSAWTEARTTAGHGPAMLQADTARMSRSLDGVRTRDPQLRPDPGPAPVLVVQSEAQSDMRASRGELDRRVTQAGSQARQETLQPAGEDSIAPTVPTETLTAQSGGDAQAGAGASTGDAPALPDSAGVALGAADAGGGAGGADAQAIGIIAQQERGAEIDTALAQARANMAAERQTHEQTRAQAEATGREEVATLSAQARVEQEQARARAQSEGSRARSDWQAEITQHSTAARTQADARVQEGLTGVAAEEQRGQTQAQQHTRDGQRRAESEKQKGEREAESQKQRAKGQSRGFLGWLGDRARDFLDGVKKAVSSIIDAARRAVRRVLDEAKRLASAAIERARRAVTGLIRRVGQALMAIGDRLLARFPAVRARFRKAIQGFVDRAVQAVNAIANGLKRGVQAVLDRIGQGIDAALGLLERGLHAIVDGVNSMVQGALEFARGMAQSFGAFLGLIKDIAFHPGSWLGKLGAAIMDGIRNHLWQALKTAVMSWFQSKVLELLGIGGLIIQLLQEGGISFESIGQMAWEALQSAVPAALISILIEKLVSMIVPAAGAVLAIIEGLQAAWGTVSRIIAAFGAFIAFLRAVKGGSAGPLFANLLASAAVVVLDFVANWLLRKLRSAAGKVGNKLKGMAERFRNRRRGRRGRGRGRRDRRRERRGRRRQRGRDREHGNDSRRRNRDDGGNDMQRKRARLERAVQQIRPKVHKLLQRGVSRRRLQVQLAWWRVRHGLTSLTVDSQGRIMATVNPSMEVEAGHSITDQELGETLYPILQEAATQAVRAIRQDPEREPQLNAINESIVGGKGIPEGASLSSFIAAVRLLPGGKTLANIMNMKNGAAKHTKNSAHVPLGNGLHFFSSVKHRRFLSGFLKKGGSYENLAERMAKDPELRTHAEFLAQWIEPARDPGAAIAYMFSQQMGVADPLSTATLDEQRHGRIGKGTIEAHGVNKGANMEQLNPTGLGIQNPMAMPGALQEKALANSHRNHSVGAICRMVIEGLRGTQGYSLGAVPRELAQRLERYVKAEFRAKRNKIAEEGLDALKHDLILTLKGFFMAM
jgi:hypothetical protein